MTDAQFLLIIGTIWMAPHKPDGVNRIAGYFFLIWGAVLMIRGLA